MSDENHTAEEAEATRDLLYGSVLLQGLGNDYLTPDALVRHAQRNETVAKFVFAAGGSDLAAILLSHFKTREQLKDFIVRNEYKWDS